MKERFTLAKIDFPWAPRVSDTVSTLGFSWKCQLLKASFSGKSYHETGASPTNQRVSKHDTSWKEPDPKLSKSCGILVRSERILQSKHSSRSTSAMRHTPGPSYGKSLPGAFHAAAARLRVVVWWCQVAPPTMLVTNGRRAFFLISAFKKWIMFMSTIFLDSVRLSRSFRPAQVLQIQINAGIIYPIGSINTKRADINKHHNCKFIKWGLIHPGFFCYPSRYSKQQRSKAACTIWVINPPATEDLGDSQSRSAFSTLRYPLQSNMAMGNSWNTWLWLPLFQIYIYMFIDRWMKFHIPRQWSSFTWLWVKIKNQKSSTGIFQAALTTGG